jgi:ABC-type nickel/cobalt efflux system permease component RcnA
MLIMNTIHPKQKFLSPDNPLVQVAAMARTPDTEENIDRTFFGIVSWSTALCFGGVVASLESLYKDQSGFAFHINAATFITFALGTVAGLAYWRIASISGLVRKVSSLLLVLLGVGAFLYPLRFLPREKFTEVFEGFVAAVFVLSLGAFILWRVTRFLDRDAADEEAEEKHESRRNAPGA